MIFLYMIRLKERQNAFKKLSYKERKKKNIIIFTISAQFVWIILEIYECINEIIPTHIVLLSIINGIPGNVCYELDNIMIIENISKVLEEPRKLS